MYRGSQTRSSDTLQQVIKLKEAGSYFSNVTEQKIRQMHMLFDLNDTNRSNSIGLEEFKKIATYLDQLFQQFDPEEDGQLDFDNFLRAFEGATITRTGHHAVSPQFAAASHTALINETDELRRDMEGMQTNYLKRISDQKALNEETEDLMAAQAKEFDEMEEKARETEIRLRGQVKTVTSALDEASTLVEKREVQLAALESEIARVRRELHETKTSEEGFKSN
eukprot:gene26598-29037_t